jgi:hypothetical protein
VDIDRNGGHASAPKPGSYILSIGPDGAPLLHGPYVTPRARMRVALQFGEEAPQDTLFFVDYTAEGIHAEVFDPSTLESRRVSR